MRNSPLARCSLDGVPVVLKVSTPRCFMDAVRASQDDAWSSVVMRCELCGRTVDSLAAPPAVGERSSVAVLARASRRSNASREGRSA